MSRKIIDFLRVVDNEFRAVSESLLTFHNAVRSPSGWDFIAEMVASIQDALVWRGKEGSAKPKTSC